MDYPVGTAEQLGAILRGFRKQQGLTQKDLAARLGLAQKAVSAVETHPSRVSVDRLFAMLGALGGELVIRDRSSKRGAKVDW